MCRPHSHVTRAVIGVLETTVSAPVSAFTRNSLKTLSFTVTPNAVPVTGFTASDRNVSDSDVNSVAAVPSANRKSRMDHAPPDVSMSMRLFGGSVPPPPPQHQQGS
jgi:hypothetical protein